MTQLWLNFKNWKFLVKLKSGLTLVKLKKCQIFYKQKKVVKLWLNSKYLANLS
jgi:hypothetical protein